MKLFVRGLALSGFTFGMSACGNSNPPAPAFPEKPVTQNPPASPATAPTGENNNPISGMYANDLGDNKADEKQIPPDLVNGYKLVKAKCSKCHVAARPLNAQFVEADDVFRAKLLASNPKALDDPRLLKLESDAWRRLIKRMMAKPGNEISSNDAKAIHSFLVWYYLDKVGTNGVASESWINHRKELLSEFKNKYPARYKELYENK